MDRDRRDPVCRMQNKPFARRWVVTAAKWRGSSDVFVQRHSAFASAVVIFLKAAPDRLLCAGGSASGATEVAAEFQVGSDPTVTVR